MTYVCFFLLALASANLVSKLHSHSHEENHSRGWNTCTCSLVLVFVAKTQNPSLFEFFFHEFTILPLKDFVDIDRNEMPQCPLRAIECYLSRLDQWGVWETSFSPDGSGDNVPNW